MQVSYTPPGWRRGLALLVLLVLAVLVLATLAVLPLYLNGGEIPEYAPYYYRVGNGAEADLAALQEAVWFGAALSGLTALLMLVPFLLLHRWLVRQPVSALNGPRGRFRSGFVTSTLFVSGVWAVYLTYLFATTEIDPRVWMRAAPLAAVLLIGLLPLQVYAEELIFRGFLQRWLEARTRNYAIAMLVQSALFAAMHPDAFLVIFVLAILATEATRVTGSLGAATGIHLAHNLGIYLKAFLPFEDGAVLAGYAEHAAIGVAMMILLIAQLILVPVLRRRTEALGEPVRFSSLDDPARTS